MRSRGGIPSAFPVLAIFIAVVMAFPLDTGVTGQYLHVRYRSVPQAPSVVILFLSPGRRCSPQKGSSYEEKRILLVAPVARAPRIRGSRLAARWAWGHASTHRNCW